jgi:hypothetical protein
LSKWNGKPSKKGTGFEQPLIAHQHWHVGVSYINIQRDILLPVQHSGRYIVNWDLRESMAEADIEIILERAKELHPQARPRIISDNGRVRKGPIGPLSVAADTSKRCAVDRE